MLEAVITSKTRLKLLLKFFINSTTSAYLRELAEEFGGSTNGIRVELNRFVDAGLLESRSEGRTVLYSANTKNNLFRDIENIARKYVGIDHIVDNVLSELGQLDAAWVVGDYARGIDGGLIDLVLVGEIKHDVLQSVVAKAEAVIGRKIRSLVLGEGELDTLRESLDMESALPIWNAEARQGGGE